MSVVACQFMGRFGNNLFQYAFARAYAEKHGLEFQCDPWIGQKIFQIKDKPIANPESLTKRNENDLVDGEGDILFRSYCQQQKCLIYTRSQVQKWFQFQPWVDAALCTLPDKFKAVAHRRVGDYSGYGYPVISTGSYLDKFLDMGISGFSILSEESPIVDDTFIGEFSFVPDFYCMVYAEILLRGNSTFSWWAATLNRHGKIYSPVMDDCEGGKENDVQFVEGNHPRFRSGLEFITDLYLQP